MNIIALLMTMLETIAPTLTGSGAIQSVVTTLTQIVPVLVKEYQDVLPSVKNIISALGENGDVTDEQWDQLEALEAVIDKAFEDAAAAAQGEDNA